MTGWVVCWLTDWLAGSLTGWLAGWLAKGWRKNSWREGKKIAFSSAAKEERFKVYCKHKTEVRKIKYFPESKIMHRRLLNGVTWTVSILKEVLHFYFSITSQHPFETCWEDGVLPCCCRRRLKNIQKVPLGPKAKSFYTLNGTGGEEGSQDRLGPRAHDWAKDQSYLSENFFQAPW